MNDSENIQSPASRLKKWVLLFVIAAFLLIIFVFAKNSSFIVVQAESSSSTQATIEVTDPAGKVKQLKSTAGKKRVRVGVGDYGIAVKEGNKSYFEAVKTKGFFRSISVAAKTQPEKRRTFVGNNPNLCMEYLTSKLISYACSDRFENISMHVPATATTPTYVLKNPNKSIGGFVEGMVKTSSGTLVLVKQNAVGDEEGSHTIFTVDDNLAASNLHVLTDLDVNTSYYLTGYREGFLTYSQTRGEALYYASLASKPEPIKLEAPEDTNFSINGVATRGSSILLLYSQPADGKSKKQASEIRITSGGAWKTFGLKNNYTEARLCGQNKVCAVANETMDVYDVATEKPKLLYSVKNAISIKNDGNELLVIRSSDVLRLDVEKRAGFIDYSFGDYSFTALQPEPSGYIVSMTNNKGKKVALLIDGELSNEDSIDKKVAELQKNGAVRDVSAYGNFIYVSPETGELKYIDSLGEFGYDPLVVKQKNTEINQVVSKIGIDRNKYTIISTVK
jgi:hypothetical protein